MSTIDAVKFDNIIDIVKEFFEEVRLPEPTGELKALLESEESELLRNQMPAVSVVPESIDTTLNRLYAAAEANAMKLLDYEKTFRDRLYDVSVKEELGSIHIIDTLEEYMDKHKLTYVDPEREEAEDDNAAIIYGTRFVTLTDTLTETLLYLSILMLHSLCSDVLIAEQGDTWQEKEDAFTTLVEKYGLRSPEA